MGDLSSELREPRPSKMLIQLLETTNPTDDRPQHLTELGNEHNALFLMRQGSQAVIGYLINSWPGYKERVEFFGKMEELKREGVRVQTDTEESIDGSDFYIGASEKPSVRASFVDLSKDDRFSIDGDPPSPGHAMVTVTVSLDDLVQNPPVSHILDAVASYYAPQPALPRQFSAFFGYNDPVEVARSTGSFFAMIDVAKGVLAKMERGEELTTGEREVMVGTLEQEREITAGTLEQALELARAIKTSGDARLSLEAKYHGMAANFLFKSPLIRTALEGIKGSYEKSVDFLSGSAYAVHEKFRREGK